MNKPKVSIIMPLYNEEAFVNDALTSILNQTYTDWEIIIIDDGSTDNSFKQVTKFLDYMGENHLNTATIYQCKTGINKGIGWARKTGVSMARGEYITFLSADDVWTKKFLKQMLNNYGGGIIFCDYDTITPGGGRIKREQLLPHKEKTIFDTETFKNKVFQAARNHGMFVNYSAILGNKKYFTGEFEFLEDLKFGEDLHHLLNTCRTIKYTYLPEALIMYREHENNTTNKQMNHIHENNKKIFKLFGETI